ncbi:MAG TPA: SRPBCC domain-containing protein [Bacteroidota bacterium]|nr:SRPBCC domain-containing protein [Bacteroidota bacterium]
MKEPAKTIEVKVERTIQAPPGEVFDGWLNPKVPGTPWHEGDKLIFNPKVDGLFYWLMSGTPHFGRFKEVKRPARIQHTWMSPNTLGHESTVTLTFEKKGEETLLTLVHSGLPDNEGGKGHEGGWNYFLDKFYKQFGKKADKKK